MGNTLYDKLKLLHDIEERQEIVNRYQRHSFIDRNHVIQKILELRSLDKEVNAVALTEQTVYPGLPLPDCPNIVLINELQKQIAILQAKLYANTQEQL